jgi:hypothetical protein
VQKYVYQSIFIAAARATAEQRHGCTCLVSDDARHRCQDGLDKSASTTGVGNTASTKYKCHTRGDMTTTHTHARTRRDVMALHVLNHVITSRDTILRNNDRLKKKKTEEARDQGYTRAKVLVLLPCRNSAYAFVRRLLQLYPGAHAPGGRVDAEDRFEKEFGPEDDARERKADEDRLLKVPAPPVVVYAIWHTGTCNLALHIRYRLPRQGSMHVHMH